MLMLHKVASVLICETSPLDDQFRWKFFPCGFRLLSVLVVANQVTNQTVMLATTRNVLTTVTVAECTASRGNSTETEPWRHPEKRRDGKMPTNPNLVSCRAEHTWANHLTKYLHNSKSIPPATTWVFEFIAYGLWLICCSRQMKCVRLSVCVFFSPCSRIPFATLQYYPRKCQMGPVN